MASTSSSLSSSTLRATRTSPSSSIDSTPTPPLPTRAPLQDRSNTHQELYRAYAIPVRGIAGDRQVINDSNNPEVAADLISQSFVSLGKGKGKAVETDDNGYSETGKRRRNSGSLRRRTSNRRRTAVGGLDLGLVSGFQEARRSLEKRLPMAEGYPSCNYVGNGILSCYPESNTTIVQGEYSKFIWNAQFPTFIGAGEVDIYLYNANTEEVATSWLGVQNARGMIGITPDEEWWPQESATEWFNNQNRNQSIPYYFVIVDGGSQLTGGETHQSTFTVIQTAPPTSLSSTLAILTASSLSSVSSVSAASASSASSLASQLSQSSLFSSSSSNSASSPRSTNSNGELQPSNNDGGGGPAIPKWAIAIIVILGFFALVAGAFAIYFCLGRARRRRRLQEATENNVSSNPNGSREPILGGGGSSAAGSPTSFAPALLGAGTGGAVLGAATAGGKEKEGAEEEEEEKANGLDRNDAARMAEAFRAALRRPEFPHNGQGTESSGESGGLLSGGGSNGNNLEESSKDVEEGTPEGGRELIEEELRSEGMSMRDVEGGGGKRWG
ncbi:hypothetical protein JCM5350_004999 [Sporobolomyces pararoseus]